MSVNWRGMRLFARCRRMGWSLAGSVGITVLALFLPETLGMPSGVMTSIQAPPLPQLALIPALLVMAAAVTFHTEAAGLEQMSTRPLLPLHALVVAAAVGAPLLMLVLVSWRRGGQPIAHMVCFALYLGLALMGALLIGRLGWVLVIGYFGLLVVAGYQEDHPAWWAIPMWQDPARAWPLIVLVAGVAPIMCWATWHRSLRESP